MPTIPTGHESWAAVCCFSVVDHDHSVLIMDHSVSIVMRDCSMISLVDAHMATMSDSLVWWSVMSDEVSILTQRRH